MKSVKLFRLLLLSGLISFGIACGDDDDDDVQPNNNNNNNNNGGVTISEQIAANAELDSLEVALKQVGLYSTLEGSGNYTVFAPSNQAFIQLLIDNSAQQISHLNDSTLSDLLMYHASDQAEYKSADLNGNMYIESLNTSAPNGSSVLIHVNATGGTITLNGRADITDADIDASNGVVHIIDNYLNKATMLDLLKADGRFDSLLIIVKNNNFNYETVFSTGTLTLFAPTNQAFATYLSNNGYSKVNDIPIFTRPTIMDYHYVANNSIRSSQFSQGQEITTKQTGKLIVDLSSGIQLSTVNSSQGKVNVSDTDIQGSNGVIHVVDEVLLPF